MVHPEVLVLGLSQPSVRRVRLSRGALVSTRFNQRKTDARVQADLDQTVLAVTSAGVMQFCLKACVFVVNLELSTRQHP